MQFPPLFAPLLDFPECGDEIWQDPPQNCGSRFVFPEGDKKVERQAGERERENGRHRDIEIERERREREREREKERDRERER
jgi:hypothetical protein